MSDQSESSDLQALTTRVVASHVANNSVPVADLPKLIQQVYDALVGLSSGAGGQDRLRFTADMPDEESRFAELEALLSLLAA